MAREPNKDDQKQLIPGLPDEIAMECLIRVPYQFHSNLKLVCHYWQNLITHQSFYQERRKSSIAEEFVCLVQPLTLIDSGETLNNSTSTIKRNEEDKQEQQEQQQDKTISSSTPQYALSIYNATQNIWQRTRPQEGMPMFCQCLTIHSAGKLLLLGGWDPITLEPVPHVYILDFIGPGSFKWRRGVSMSVARSFFACGVVGSSRVYVAGGHDSQKNALRSAEVYDIDKDEWRVIPDMIEERDECQGLAWEGDSRFWVVSGYGTESQGQFRSDAECYDPETGSWYKANGVWPFSSISPRGSTTTMGGSGNQQQWWWLLGGEHQIQQQQQQSGEGKENENMRWEIVNSISLPNSINGTTTCVTSLGNGASDQIERVFVMSGGGGQGGGGRRSASMAACSECDGGGAFVLEKQSSNGSTKWNHIHTPMGFSGFPYSASYLII